MGAIIEKILGHFSINYKPASYADFCVSMEIKLV